MIVDAAMELCRKHEVKSIYSNSSAAPAAKSSCPSSLSDSKSILKDLDNELRKVI